MRSKSFVLLSSIYLYGCGGVPLNEALFFNPSKKTAATDKPTAQSVAPVILSKTPQKHTKTAATEPHNKTTREPVALAHTQSMEQATPLSQAVFTPPQAAAIAETNDKPSAAEPTSKAEQAAKPSLAANPVNNKNAQALIDQGNYQQAITQLKSSHSKDTKLLALAYQKLIQHYQKQGDKLRAEQTLVNYINDIPGDVTSRSEATKKKQALEKQTKPRKAKTISKLTLQKVKRLNLEAAENYQARNFEGAKANWDSVIKMDPRNNEALAGLEKLKQWEQWLRSNSTP